MSLSRSPLMNRVLVVFFCSGFAFAAYADERGSLTGIDRGIFSDLDSRIKLSPPRWIQAQRVSLRASTSSTVIIEMDGEPVLLTRDVNEWMETAPEAIKRALSSRKVMPANRRWSDLDLDGIPDSLDVLIGARKTVENGALYGGPLQRIPYPGGDVDRARGVCTDVVIRALRNAGIDLQKEVIEDMRANPTAYRLKGEKPIPTIDHRRVRRQIVYFKRHYRALETNFSRRGRGEDAWLPGDIVFMDTLPKYGPDHVGIISDRVDQNGRPMIINNWDEGHRTSDMSLLESVPITHRFRVSLPL